MVAGMSPDLDPVSIILSTCQLLLCPFLPPASTDSTVESTHSQEKSLETRRFYSLHNLLGELREEEKKIKIKY